MGLVQLTRKVMAFIMMMKENNNKITKSTQDMYGSVSYYIMIQYLKKEGIVSCEKIDDNNQKIWSLTEKGMKIADKLYELRGVIDGKGEGDCS